MTWPVNIYKDCEKQISFILRISIHLLVIEKNSLSQQVLYFRNKGGADERLSQNKTLGQGRPTFLSDRPYLLFKNFRGP